MDFKYVKVSSNFNILFYTKIFIILSYVYTTCGDKTQRTLSWAEDYDPKIVLMDDWVDHVRQRRDTALPTASVAAEPPTKAVASTNTSVIAASSNSSNIIDASATTVAANVTTANVTAQRNITSDDSNRTTKSGTESSTSAAPPLVVTRIPLLGVNGSGQYHGNLPNNTLKVGQTNVTDDDNISIDVFKETPERIKAEQNITNLKYDNHTYYNSVFIGNISFFNEHWTNITKSKPEIHNVLSNSHRRATTLKLPFDFKFYGNPIPEITVATGGFIYTGDHVHNWLAATQYIAPLMANFDTTFSNESVVKLYKDDDKFTALWENVALREEKNKTFTFAVTLYKNGDIIFAYKDIPLPISAINDTDHPVKIGISDAYLTDRIALHVRTKTIYEYHRVSFKSYEITNNTILKLVAQPTCLQYDTCDACVNHNTAFNCSWCEQIKKCSSGTDRKKQDWLLRHCDKIQITNDSFCPAPTNGSNIDANSTSYLIDSKINPLHDTIFRENPDEANTNVKDGVIKTPMRQSIIGEGKQQESHSAIGGVVAVFIIVTLISSLAAWVLYAFKNPHTRSGQLLIKYRPSQWSWRRGEARYTAATIHM